MEHVWKIYKLTSPCGAAYIGITRNTVLWRWKAHVRQSRKDDAAPLYVAIRTYGPESFSRETLTECVSEWEAQKCERAMIALHNTFHKNGGFNRSIGGNGNTGGVTEETRAKLKASLALRKDENRAVILAASKKYNQMGRPVSEEGHARKLAALAAGRPLRLTPEALAKRAKTQTGKHQSPEHRAKSVAACAAARAAKTSESLKKQSTTLKKMWADPEYAALKRHRFWALVQYEKAMAARIGRERRFSLRGVKESA